MTRRTALTSLDQWEKQGLRFQYRGHDIFFAKTDGPHRETLLLIHGFPTASWDWSDVWAPLAARFKLVAPDLIGFGFSPKPPDYEYSIHDQADLCEALLSRAGIREYHILAHDYGDTVAQELLARANVNANEGGMRPVLKSVCFLNGGLFPETHRPRFIQRLLSSPLGPFVASRMSKEKFAANMLAIAGPDFPPTDEEIAGFWSLILHNDGQKVFPKLIRYMRERRKFRSRWVGALVDSKIPLRLINGAADPISGEHMAARYCELVAHSDCILLGGVGHYPQVEVPSMVVDLLLNFHDTRVTPALSTKLKVSA